MMDIVEELRRDRESGAKRLVCEYKAGLMSIARRFFSDEGDAEELVNATFAKAVDNIDGYLEKSAFFAWLCQILTNEFRNSVKRKSNRNEVYPGVLPEVEDEDARNEIYDNLDATLLREAIAELQPEQREVIVLRYFEDLPIAKIAKFLALPAGTVRSRIFYARRALAARIGAKAHEAVKKPGVKATLLALALFVTAALGAAGVAAISAATNAQCTMHDAQCVSSGGPRSVAAANGETSETSGTGETSGSSPVASVSSPVPPDSPVPPVITQSLSSKDPTMNSTTRSAALGAATALALAAAPPAASADGYQYIVSGNQEYDPPASFLASGGTSLAGGPLSSRSAADALDARFRTSMASAGTGFRSDKYSGFSIIIR